MPLAPREIDTIFSACDVRDGRSNLPTHPDPSSSPTPPPSTIYTTTQHYTATQDYTTRTTPTPTLYQVDGNGSIDWNEFAGAFREALQESPFRQGDVWKGG